MLERCEFCELNEEVLRECGGFSCKDGDITEFFTSRRFHRSQFEHPCRPASEQPA